MIRAIARSQSVVPSSSSSKLRLLKMETKAKKTRPTTTNVTEPRLNNDDPLFEMDETLLFGPYCSPDDSSSSEDSDDEHVTTRPRSPARPMLARSLPIPVPIFLRDRNITGRYQREQSPDETPLDIHGSIKALAQSLRGDAVFGELPPHRFQTEE